MEKKADIDLKTIVPKRNSDAAFRVIEGEAIVVLPSKSEVKVLNEVGSRIWQLIDGTATAADICRKLCEEYEVSEETAEKDVKTFIRELGDQGMLQS